ncbi:ATP-dependent exoDNAse alpha subunit - helicase superfamily I member [Aquipluma nitroreducens]|uniref:ATP-dependent exoDNAse alpha subunit - helicase superfamily I member n=1 Tax=Aquipluma nitroreducens TaxID=2010828 RepID=A0A5K7S395_9BACT|nr:DUF3108 domain-containing protein [Aquipluma nitroreducens]BBE16031.1 ATP-dependent exoDNAse alpha subunit - helicase superfamily I member [Aquipluma nitroreducens]
MKIRLGILFIILLQGSYINAQEIFSPQVKPNTAFGKDEKLTYQIKYGFIVGGIATLSLNEAIENGEKVFHALAVGKTTGLANTIYGVEDTYESWFDKATNLPFKSVRNIREGRYRKYNEVSYNHKHNTVHSKLSGVHSVPVKILDLTSTFYYLRRVDWSVMNKGDVVFVNMYFSDEIFPFRIIFKGKETIQTNFGKIECFKIMPVVEVGRMFKRSDDLTIWLTDDDNCIPVQVRMDIRIVGNVYLKLIKYENIANPLASQE